MKRILSFYYIKLFIFCQVLMLTLSIVVFTNNASATNTNAFYFEDATFDYYLEKAPDGTSNLHVSETLTAIFPDTNQNHGITRSIPYTNQNGKNITAGNTAALNFQVQRNGKSEPVSKTDKENGHYIFYVGDKNEYVHGRQIYTITYDFSNVITEFDSAGQLTFGNNGATFQELYWDTNGTGWSQKFQKLTANLHLEDTAKASLLADKTSCYVGYYGASGSNRCAILTAENVISFTTSNLSAGENLTFVVDFKPNTFVVPEPSKNYILLIVTAIVVAICIFIIFFRIRSYLKKVKPKKDYYKSLFTAPQYDAPKDYRVAEASLLYLGKKEKTYVASLLELAISKKISIVKGEPTKVLKKDTWKIKINNLDDITDSQDDLLRILNGGPKVHVGDEIPIKKHTATSTLASLSRDYTSDASANLSRLKLFDKKVTFNSVSASASAITIVILALIFGVIPVIITLDTSLIKELFGLGYGIIFGIEYLPTIIVGITILTISICIYTAHLNAKYGKYSNAGLDQAKYLEGLHLYINMAEKDRLKFLQSVKGADTSPEGIVHLYEKLLPYACLFGVEESWFKELGKFCQEYNYSLDWYSGNDLASFYVMNSIANSINSSVSASTSYTSSSSGSSSGFSGGGGGGFSGGGGGGGGGGGW